jgi:membrane-associated protein
MHFLDPETIIATGGLALIAFIIFAECGLLFGFFFPGDTLLFAAGFFASQGHIALAGLLAVIILSAIAGNAVGYEIGKRAGPRLFRKGDGIVFRKEYIQQAEAFYEKHGGKTVILARFVPVVRTFAPVVAGIGKMDVKLFTFYNVLGSFIWGIGVTMLGYYLGSKIPNIDTYLLPIILLAMTLSFGPTLYHIFKDPVSRQKLKERMLRK